MFFIVAPMCAHWRSLRAPFPSADLRGPDVSTYAIANVDAIAHFVTDYHGYANGVTLGLAVPRRNRDSDGHGNGHAPEP